MSSWSLVLALSGFSYSAPQQRIGFAPRVNANKFTTFWSTGSGWGQFSQRVTAAGITAKLSVTYGELTVREIDLGSGGKGQARIKLGASAQQPDAEVRQMRDGSVATFAAPITLRAGDEIEISVRNS